MRRRSCRRTGRLAVALVLALHGCASRSGGTDPARADGDRPRDGATADGTTSDGTAAGDAAADGADASGPRRRRRPPPGTRTDRPNYVLDVRAADGRLAELVKDNTLFGQWQYRADYSPNQKELFLARAPDEIRQALSTEGYFEPVVDVSGPDERTVVVRIDPGPRVTIGDVDIRFDGEIAGPQYAARRDAFRRGWSLKAGAPFRQSDWSSAKGALVQDLRREGFPRAELRDSRASVDTQRHRADLTVVVDSRDLMRFGAVRYEGLQRYPESVLAALITFRPGDPYSLRQLVDYSTALRNTRYFASVNVLPDLEALQKDPDLKEVPVQVRVEEAKSERLTTGIGVSSDRGFRWQLGWTDRNLFGRAWVLDSTLLVDQLSALASIGLKTPRDARGGYYTVGARLDRQSIQGVRNEVGTVYGGYGVQRQKWEWLATVAYQYDRQTIFSDLSPVAATNAHALVPGIAWSTHRFDDRVSPTRGHAIALQASGAHKAMLSTASFVRLYAMGVHFMPMPLDGRLSGDTLMVRGELGGVMARSREGIPSENLFRTGGAQSVRGYRFQSLGLRYGSAVLPARYLMVGSVEYIRRITPIVGAAVFYDRGNAYDDWGRRSLVAGYGVGGRLRTPLGPVNLDLAWGQADRRLRFHFSIGYTF